MIISSNFLGFKCKILAKKFCLNFTKISLFFNKKIKFILAKIGQKIVKLF
jgi:hypothetical protein